jgi:hypothetical protein
MNNALVRDAWFQKLVSLAKSTSGNNDELFGEIDKLPSSNLAKIEAKKVLEVSFATDTYRFFEQVAADALALRLSLWGLVEPNDLARFCQTPPKMKSIFFRKIESNLKLVNLAKIGR